MSMSNTSETALIPFNSPQFREGHLPFVVVSAKTAAAAWHVFPANVQTKV